jgi:hypothetical protein
VPKQHPWWLQKTLRCIFRFRFVLLGEMSLYSILLHFCNIPPKVFFVYLNPTQVSDGGPTENVAPLTFYLNGIFVSGELWGYWWRSFPGSTAADMFEDVERDVDDEGAEFTRSLAWWGPPPS